MGDFLQGIVAGVDEAGRGPLAGPVLAAAVILDPKKPITGLKDSKLLSAKKREMLYVDIIEKCMTFGVGQASVSEIDSINILQASLLAMRRAVARLTVMPNLVLVDGNQNPRLPYLTRLIVRGDVLEPVISAASIIAKVTRDRIMCELDIQYPHFGFAIHKGYATERHLAALQKLGATPFHRKTFRGTWRNDI